MQTVRRADTEDKSKSEMRMPEPEQKTHPRDQQDNANNQGCVTPLRVTVGKARNRKSRSRAQQYVLIKRSFL